MRILKYVILIFPAPLSWSRGTFGGSKPEMRSNVGAARTCLSNADLLEVVKEVDQPGFGISLDPGNVVYYTHRHVDGEEPVRNPFPSFGGGGSGGLE